MADDLAVTPGSGATLAADDVGGVLYERVKPALGDPGSAVDVGTPGLPIEVVQALPVTVGFPSQSIGTTMGGANIYRGAVVWLVPSGKVFIPKVARSAVTTAGSQTIIGAGQVMGSWDQLRWPNPYWVSGGSVSPPDRYDALFLRYLTNNPAGGWTPGIDLVDGDGTITWADWYDGDYAVPGSEPANTWERLRITGNTGLGRGCSQVTGTSQLGYPSAYEVWGLRTLFESQGPAALADLENLARSGFHVPDTESVVVLIHAAATTAQVRSASVSGQLVDA